MISENKVKGPSLYFEVSCGFLVSILLFLLYAISGSDLVFPVLGNSVRYVKGVLLLILGLGLLLLLWKYREKRLAKVGLVFVAVWVAYQPITLTARMTAGDSFWYIPSAMSLLADGDFDLTEFRAPAYELLPAIKAVKDFDSDWRLVQVDGRVYNFYNLYTSLISSPLVLIGNIWYRGETQTIRRAMLIAPFVAKIFAAASVALFFYILLTLGHRWPLALAFSLVFAFFTTHLVYHAGGIWSHNTSSFCLLLALAISRYRNGIYCWLSAVPVALSFAMRFEMGILVLVFSLYIYFNHRSSLVRYLILGMLCAAIFFLHSLLIYRNVLPPMHAFGGSAQVSPASISQALRAHLFSPNRGLFVFCPIFLFSMWGAVRAWRRNPRAEMAIYRWMSILVGGHLVGMSTHPMWWAGWSYGPRFFTPVCALWTLLLLPWWHWEREQQGLWKKARIATFGVLLGWSGFVMLVGVTQVEAHTWNSIPSNVDLNPERVWDWHDLQIFRGFKDIR